MKKLLFTSLLGLGLLMPATFSATTNTNASAREFASKKPKKTKSKKSRKKQINKLEIFKILFTKQRWVYLQRTSALCRTKRRMLLLLGKQQTVCRQIILLRM
ncbi:hypothetical protein HX13_16355 [Chryseobacterium sp. P1-3]|uniref:hypothetical protein n=1 Tax=Chryseobacterium sp. (strain P1-3) TaxID=1517683 RepID=UPI0004E6E0AF|nr:hypothetical protein [Chryseobacterium sp. P1-3]KFF74058.1 hypothetical protein HX13_16355 [Chryseobacterium sp. P1-3]